MDFSIPLAGMQAASTAFDNAANGITRASGSGTPSTGSVSNGDTVDLSTSFVNLAGAKLDFTANVKMAEVEDQMNQSTFSILG